MTISVLRTSEAWWVKTAPGKVAPIRTEATSTGELLADRSAIADARTSSKTVALKELTLCSPVTRPCRVIAQMTNYVSHVRDTGMDPNTVPLTFFRKASASISGPYDDIVKPSHVEFLDYEIEIGLVVGTHVPVGTTVSTSSMRQIIAGLVITNDVSARDVQLPQTQYYEAKSYPTFLPVGPELVLLEDTELERFGQLHLQLRVNGEQRQNGKVDGDMIYPPLRALQSLSRFQPLDPGDLILTGTPVGTAISAPPRPLEMVGSLLPPALRWKAFFRRQAGNPRWLHPGDQLELSIRTDDGTIDLGVQRTPVAGPPTP
jgi:2-keto-4-pentenoate hydratase/2-oxohepta-3-ene-1,7-dioic acid hydratase in catechol pathway